MPRQVRLASFDQVLAELDALAAAARVESEGAWSPGRAIAHCAHSIECSLQGYPQLKSALFRATLGRGARWKFLRQAAMSHDLAAEILGVEPPAAAPPLPDALARLRAAIVAFRAHKGPLAPHLAFGEMDAAVYERIHAMHAADHLGAIAVH